MVVLSDVVGLGAAKVDEDSGGQNGLRCRWAALCKVHRPYHEAAFRRLSMQNDLKHLKSTKAMNMINMFLAFFFAF